MDSVILLDFRTFSSEELKAAAMAAAWSTVADLGTAD
jgi:hypothetical protein